MKEFSEYVAAGALPPSGELRMGERRARVALQDSCHLRNAIGVWREPRALISAIADYVELPGAAQCCGAAGAYSLLRRKESRQILDQKLDQIEAAGIDYVAAVNPRCVRQLKIGLRRRRSQIRAVQVVELLTAAQQSGAVARQGGSGFDG